MPEEKDWSNIAGDFDERQDVLIGEATNKIIKKELCSLKRLGSMLELGCGNGKYTKFMAESADEIIATDVSEEMVSVSRNKLKSFKNIVVEYSDCYKTQYETHRFDTVFMGNLIHVILEPEKALSEAYRVLKKRGALILLSFTIDGMTPENINSLNEKYLDKFGAFPQVKGPMTLNSLSRLVEKNKFTIQKAELIGEDTKAMLVIAHT